MQPVPGQGSSWQPQVQRFGCMRAAGSEAEQLKNSAGREGAGNCTNCSGCCRSLACHTFFSELLAFLMAENGNAEALP